MKGIVGSLGGAAALGTLTAFYHQSLPLESRLDTQWGLLLLQAAPAGAALGLAAELALQVPAGARRALCCFTGALLSLAPLALWCWLAATRNPFDALPTLLRLFLLSVPTLAASFLMSLWGLASLRPARFRTREQESSD